MSQGFTSQLPVPLPTAQGGTGLTSTTAYAVLCGGTTSTGNLQSIASVGTTGQVLTSNGAGALPTFQNPATQTSATKGWLYSKLSAGVPQLSASFNVTSITDNGTGDFTVNWSTAFSTADYCAVAGYNRANDTGVAFIPNFYSQTTSSVRISTTNNTGTAIDPYAFHIASFGAQ